MNYLIDWAFISKYLIHFNVISFSSTKVPVHRSIRIYRRQILAYNDGPRAERVQTYTAELFASIFRHLKLELLTQFSASNDKKYFYLWKVYATSNELFD